LEHNYKKAKEIIKYFYKNRDKIITIDKEIDFYDKKISLFENFIKTQSLFNNKEK
jgi:hypothetical protein